MSQDIVIERVGRLAKLTLNRPKALNALDHGQVVALRAAFDEWRDDDDVACVLLKGEGDRAFCAGGDVRAVRSALLDLGGPGAYDPQTVDAAALPYAFFFDEYAINAAIGAFPKPIVALMDGVVMGGGLGLGVHSSHRIATERSLMAMPEAAIGLFPDVGASLFLNDAPGGIGRYLAAAGVRVKGAADAIYIGFATHYAPSARLDAVIEALETADWGDEGENSAIVDAALAGVCDDPGPSSLKARQDAIDRCFLAPATPIETLANLDQEGDAWAVETAAAMRAGSPTTVTLIYEQLRRTAGLSLTDALTIEFRLGQFCMTRPDFVEGVRAVLVDKDNAPKWSPARLADVDMAEIARAFEPLGARDLTFD